jgi:hypothetical protein
MAMIEVGQMGGSSKFCCQSQIPSFIIQLLFMLIHLFNHPGNVTRNYFGHLETKSTANSALRTFLAGNINAPGTFPYKLNMIIGQE